MFGSLVFLEIVYNDSLQQILISSRGKIHEKKLGPKFGPKPAKIKPKIRFFCHFLKFGSLLFLKIACNDSLKQFVTFNRGEIYEKYFGLKFGPKGPKSDPKLSFLLFSQVCFVSFPLSCIGWQLGTMYK